VVTQAFSGIMAQRKFRFILQQPLILRTSDFKKCRVNYTVLLTVYIHIYINKIF
jgi:hypothetical protein